MSVMPRLRNSVINSILLLILDIYTCNNICTNIYQSVVYRDKYIHIYIYIYMYIYIYIYIYTYTGFTVGSGIRNPPANAGDSGDLDLIPMSGRSSGEGNGNPLQYSCQGNPMDRGAW